MNIDDTYISKKHKVPVGLRVPSGSESQRARQA